MRSDKNASGSASEATEGAAQAIRTSARAASKASSEMRKNVMNWRETVMREAKEHPGRTAAIALGAGYLLGGGLFSALTARIVATGVRVGLRLALIPLVTQGVASLGEGLFSGQGGGGEEEASESSQARSETRNGRRQTSDQKETNS